MQPDRMADTRIAAIDSAAQSTNGQRMKYSRAAPDDTEAGTTAASIDGNQASAHSLSAKRSSRIAWPKKLWNHHWCENWAIEILSPIVACVALATIFITLALHRNKPLPKWPNSMSVNSLISVFTAIMKAALMLPVAEGTTYIRRDNFHETF